MSKSIIKKILLIVIFTSYALCIHEVWILSKFGGLRKQIITIGITFVILLLSLLGLIVLHKKIDKTKMFKYRKSFVAVIMCFIVITVFFAGKIIHAAIPYNGALSWKIDSLLHHKPIPFSEQNIYEDGINKFMADLESKLDLPEKKYIADDFNIEFDQQGQITLVETFLYGQNKKGKDNTFLIYYNAEKDPNNISVDVDGFVNVTYQEEKSLDPMIQILNQIDLKKEMFNFQTNSEVEHYHLSYSGRQRFYAGQKLIPISGNISSDNAVEGFAVTLTPLNQDNILPLIFISEPESISAQAIQQEHQEQQFEIAQQAESWTVDHNDGSVIFSAKDNPQVAWKLNVVNAALGSRYYDLQYTEDGAKTWTTINRDPFDNTAGVASGIEFFDDQYGYIGIAGASGSYSTIFVTRDGGISFQKIDLPLSSMANFPHGTSIEDYKYLSMPVLTQGKLSILVKTEAAESDGFTFVSLDQGVTWQIE